METEFLIIILAIILIIISFIMGCKIGKLKADKAFESEMLKVIDKVHCETKTLINNYEKSKE